MTTDQRKDLLRWAKSRAKTRKLPFNLTLDDIYIPSHCPILGIPLRRGVGVPGDHSPSLDRITPDLGYVKGNVVVVSSLANRIKSTATSQVLIRVAAFLQQMNR